MELSTVQINDFIPKINDGESFQEILVSHSSEKCPVTSARLILPNKRKTLEEDALLAVKLDPAVLEAQVTLTKEGEKTPAQDNENSALVAGTEPKDARCYPSYEEVVSMHEAALLGLTPQQLTLLMVFVDMLRRQRQHSQILMYCAFCKNNGLPASWYTSHTLRDRRRTRCPVLRAMRCPRCGATGDHAHTTSCCPQNIFSDSSSCP